MAISHRASGSWAYASSGSVTPTLPTHSAGDMLIVRVAAKSSNIASLDITTATSGWARIGQFRNGTTNSGNGTGSVQVAAFWKEAASGSDTAPTIDFSQTVTQVGHVAISYQKGGSESWMTPVGDGGPDTTSGTSHSATIQSHVSVTAGDMVDSFTGICDDTTMTVPTITQTGVTYAAVSEQPATAGTDTSGADGAYDGSYRLANSGTSSAAAVVTGTTSTTETGTSWMTRLRVFTPETHDGGFTLTGGGTTSTASSKGGQQGLTLTGGGTTSETGSKQGQVGTTLTGGGAVTSPAEKGGQIAHTVTGGGTAVIDALAEFGEQHDGSFVIVGGGITLIGQATARDGGLALTGGGTTVPAASPGFAAGATITGGGTVSQAATKGTSSGLDVTGGGTTDHQADTARLGAALMSGGGVITTGQLTARDGSATITGGGIVTIEGTQAEAKEGSFVLTGGGAIATEGTRAALGELSITGGGVVLSSGQTERSASFTATGGGTAVFVGTNGEGSPVLPDVIIASVIQGPLDRVGVVPQGPAATVQRIVGVTARVTE